MEKPLIITQARISSSRLPSKVLQPLGGRIVLEWHLLRLKKTGFPIVVAIADEPGSEKIKELAIRMNVGWVKGSVDDVLSRFVLAAESIKSKVLVRVTSDCPLICPDLIKQGIEIFEKTKVSRTYLYVSNTQTRLFPRGFDFEIFNHDLLILASENAKEIHQREHVTPWMYENNKKVEMVQLEAPIDNSDLRLTLDTPEDFKMFVELFKEQTVSEMHSEDLIKYLRKHSHISSINKNVPQKSIV